MEVGTVITDLIMKIPPPSPYLEAYTHTHTHTHTQVLAEVRPA